MLENNVDKLQSQLEQLATLSEDVLGYLSSSEVTSLSIRGDITSLIERRTQ